MIKLQIKKKWFDMILSGEKKEEYREIKPYYNSRFKKHHFKEIYFNPKRDVMFINGYSKNSPRIKCEVYITEGYGKEEWGAEPNKKYYVLKILSVEKE